MVWRGDERAERDQQRSEPDSGLRDGNGPRAMQRLRGRCEPLSFACRQHFLMPNDRKLDHRIWMWHHDREPPSDRSVSAAFAALFDA
jgi:hypothetical protein